MTEMKAKIPAVSEGGNSCFMAVAVAALFLIGAVAVGVIIGASFGG